MTVSPYVLTYVEIDIDVCSLTHGTAPCTATGSGDARCFNCLATCQDRENYTTSTVTLRFAIAAEYLPTNIDAIPLLRSVDFSPGRISLGDDLGQRGSVSVAFDDAKWSDTGSGFDPYFAGRTYNPFEQGSFWGKFRARQPFLRGQPMRVIRGRLGEALADMETRHYIVDSFSGPGIDGRFTVTGKDPLKLLDGDRAQAPTVATARLSGDLTTSSSSLTLTPSGIGNAEFASSGYAAIGGKEIVSYTRSADVLTITRAQFGTVAQTHASADRVQPVLRYSGEDPADIIYDLMTTYGGVDTDFITLTAWQSETGAFNRRLYTGTIAEPTSVKQLIAELCEQAGIAIWWDDAAQRVRLQVLRQVSTDAETFDDEMIEPDSLSVEDQPDRRLSRVITYYAQNNPLEPQDDPKNYRSWALTIQSDKEADYGSQQLRKIYSRWIPDGGRSVALRVNDILLARYQDPPRRFSFTVSRESGASPVLGEGCILEAWPLQEADGSRYQASIQITRMVADAAEFMIEAEELLYPPAEPEDPNDHTIIIDGDVTNVDLKTLHDQLYPEATADTVVTCIIEDGVIIGSTSTSTPAFSVGTGWLSGTEIIIDNRGRIQGCGGAGGQGKTKNVNSATAGGAGGTALYTRKAITLIDAEGKIFGGGGGGGGGGHLELDNHKGGGGGGGAGRLGGSGGPSAYQAGSAGTLDAGGSGGLSYASNWWFEAPFPTPGGGSGGGPGLAGSTGGIMGGNATESAPGAGGAAGYSIDGVSYVTTSGSAGDRRGSQVN